MKKENNQLVSSTNQLKLTAAVGKKYLTDTFDYDEIIQIAKNFPGKQANRFIECFINSDDTIDGKSKSKAYSLFESSLLNTIEVGTDKFYTDIIGLDIKYVGIIWLLFGIWNAVNDPFC